MATKMYGTIFRLQPKSGREQDVVALMEQRPGELVGVAMFDDKATY